MAGDGRVRYDVEVDSSRGAAGIARLFVVVVRGWDRDVWGRDVGRGELELAGASSVGPVPDDR